MSFLKYWAEMSLGRMQSLKTWPSVSYLRAVRHPPVTSSSSLPSPHTFSLGLPVVRASLSDPTSCWASACLWLCVRCLEQWQPIKEIKPVNPKGNQPWIIMGRTDAQAEAPILWPPDVKSWLWKRPRCWERLRAGGEEGSRGWDGWMASPTQWTWAWVDSGR